MSKNPIRPKRRMNRWLIGTASMTATAGFLFVIAFIPAPIDGNYTGLTSSCGCDSVNFLQYRDGKMLKYSSAHPPGELLGYSIPVSQGITDVYMIPFRADKPDFRICQVRSYLFFSRFHDSNGEVSWHFKWPAWGKIAATINHQPIEMSRLESDGMVHIYHYDKNLKVIGETTRPLKKRQP